MPDPHLNCVRDPRIEELIQTTQRLHKILLNLFADIKSEPENQSLQIILELKTIIKNKDSEISTNGKMVNINV